jgi:S-formylglutathione hydrolase FrmB
MIRSLFVALSLLGLAASAQAQPGEPSSIDAIRSETFHQMLPGPNDGEHREVFYWRPPNASDGPLPVLYMADGLAGLEIAVARLRPAIMEQRARPIVIVAMASNLEDRRSEYALGRRENPIWEAHFTWFVNTVMPWAEENAGASTERAQRGVGGMSNGADWAIAAASRRPDLFGAVLAHSPVNELRSWFRSEPDTRWVISAGQSERAGEIAVLNSRIAIAIGDRPIRQCIGLWGHDLQGWRNISAGSVAWLFDLGDPHAYEVPQERESCRVRNDG